jgi:soluble lytic murein transglycosylase-like protein
MHDGMIVFRLPGGGVIGTDPARLARVHLDPPAPPQVEEPAIEDVAPASAPAANEADLGVLVRQAAARYKLDEALLRAVVQAESAFNPQAISAVGAVGLMQLMPGTARELAVEDPLDPEQNLEGGARYLRWLLDLFPGRTELALAAYNAGPGAVMRFGGIPPYRETRSYVARVLALARP